MRRLSIMFSVLSFVVLGGLFVGAPGEAGASSDPDLGGEKFVSDRVIVKLKEGATEEAVEEVNRSIGARTTDRIPRLRLTVVELPENLSVEEAVKLYESLPDVEYAQPDCLYTPSQVSPTTPATRSSTASTTPGRPAALLTPTSTRPRPGTPRPGPPRRSSRS